MPISPFTAYRLAAQAEAAQAEFVPEEFVGVTTLIGRVRTVNRRLNAARQFAADMHASNQRLREDLAAANAKIERMTSGLKQRQRAS